MHGFCMDLEIFPVHLSKLINVVKNDEKIKKN